ncbi:sensor histidine kinase [Paenibacillus nasutitermitis]|uniref:Circadian input-output histidine kinase CikA n=1 Tax=Paenibacillus nasutitermitis TaxID=1652958 RepID=A0A916YMH8_9BACL|nr:GAF domain-containing protein [Paenibacillus nasutitermitis]GGD52587.1 hypothetical protein GCM10010911_07690 [Paenibacillus nasutitermitis]
MRIEYVDNVLELITQNLYETAGNLMKTASDLIGANTFCIANNDRSTTTVLKAFNREAILLEEGLIVDNEESYCHLVIEKSEGPLIIDDNLTHPLTKDMDATRFVGACSFMGVRIVGLNGIVFGSLCAFDDKGYRFTEKEVSLLSSLAAFFANVLELEETITTLRESETEKRKLMEEKSNLLAVMSHEIRTPMNGVLGMTELLQLTDLDHDQRGMTEVIRKSGESLLTFVDHVLAYSKIDAGKMELDAAAFDIHGCLKQVMDLFQSEIDKKGISLTSEIGNEIPLILVGDEIKIRQILVNLISNAIKFTDHGQVHAQVKLKSTNYDTRTVTLAFHISDTGLGVPSDQKHRLFLSFSQLHDSSNPNNYGGSGLGLSICKQLIDLMGGDIWLDESYEGGACFVFEITLSLYADTLIPSKV